MIQNRCIWVGCPCVWTRSQPAAAAHNAPQLHASTSSKDKLHLWPITALTNQTLQNAVQKCANSQQTWGAVVFGEFGTELTTTSRRAPSIVAISSSFKMHSASAALSVPGLVGAFIWITTMQPYSHWDALSLTPTTFGYTVQYIKITTVNHRYL